MNTLIWNNNRVYEPITIKERIQYVEKNMNGLLPLYGKEKIKLIDYGKKNNLLPYDIMSLRNIIKIQKEINSSKSFNANVNKIKIKFNDLIKELRQESSNNVINKIKKFLNGTKMPINYVIKIIKPLNEYRDLNYDGINFIDKIQKAITANEIEIKNRSESFEHELEDYLRQKNITEFRTETDIKKDMDYSVTPDILFDKPIILELNGQKYPIRWMDAKNYTLVNVPFIMKSLKKQAAKYNDVFGPGAFVFHYGLDSSISIPNVVMLDGSFLK